MVAVLNMKFYKFSDTKNGDKGINSGSMVAIEKHSAREDIQIKRCEIKSKQRTNIDRDLSCNNVVIKRLDYTKIEEMKKRNHKSTNVGAFGLVFDFQDTKIENFSVEIHTKMINNFLVENGIIEYFEVLSMHCHLDEKNPHYHIMFDGWDKIKEKYAVNDFFSPLSAPKQVFNADGSKRYKKTSKGKYKLDLEGNKIPYTEQVRENGAQNLQDSWDKYLKRHEYIYTGKKQHTSLLSINSRVWRDMSEEDKDIVYYFRKLEALYNSTKSKNKSDIALPKIRDEMLKALSPVLELTQTIQEKQVKQKNKNILSPKNE